MTTRAGTITTPAPAHRKFPTGIVIAVVATLIIASLAGAFIGRRSASQPSTMDKGIITSVQSGAPLTQDQQAYLQGSLEKGQRELNSGAVAVAPPVPTAKVDFKVIDHPSAKGKIKLEALPPSRPGVVSYAYKNVTKQTLVVRFAEEWKDAAGKIVESTLSEQIILEPGRKIGPNDAGINGKSLSVWIVTE